MKKLLYFITLFILFFSCADDDQQELNEEQNLVLKYIPVGSERFNEIITSIPVSQVSIDRAFTNAVVGPIDTDLILWSNLLELESGSLLVPYFDGDANHYTVVLIEQRDDGENYYFLIKKPVNGGELLIDPIPGFSLVDLDEEDDDYSLVDINMTLSSYDVQLSIELKGGGGSSTNDSDDDNPTGVLPGGTTPPEEEVDYLEEVKK